MIVGNKYSFLVACILISQLAFGQMPKNDEKDYEYHAEASVKRAGTGDLVKRFENWGNVYFNDKTQVSIAVDDSTKRYVELDVSEPLIESYFGVNRSHKNRTLSYHIKFDSERKDFEYWINDIKYSALETDHKGRETQHDGKLSEIKSAASKSLVEEVHLRITEVIESFSEAAEIDLPE